MIETSNNHGANELPLDLLESQWDQIQKAGPRIADEVDIKSDGLSGNFRLQALAISQFFRGDADYEHALNHTGILAIANPLAQLARGNEISQSHIATATHLGFCTLSRHGSNHQNLSRIFLYPIMLSLFAIFGSVLVAFFIVPTFEQMYIEFGIAVPWVTTTFFYMGYLIRTYAIFIFVIVLGLPPLLWLINWVGHTKREPGLSRLDVLLSRERQAVSRWLLHTSLLIEAGLPNESAMQRASLLSGKRWVKQISAKRSRKPESESSIPDRHFFNHAKFCMADTALAAPRSRGQVTLLQQVATWYRDTSSGTIEWFVQLLTPLMIFFILFMILLFVMSLLSPLFSIVSGLTGGAGGFM